MNAIVLLLALAVQQPAPQDTAVVVRGLLVHAPGAGWLMALPSPFRFRERVIAELELAGDSSRWARFAGHYIEARGTLAAQPVASPRPRGSLLLAALREVDPEGAVRKTVSGSFTHRVVATLWVLPVKFAWVGPEGQPTGVGPAIVYTLNNHGESDVTLEFESKDFVCFSVEPRGGGGAPPPPWRFARQLDQPTDRLKVTLPKFVREVARVPRDAAPTPGRYIVRASLCGFKEYELETAIEVQP